MTDYFHVIDESVLLKYSFEHMDEGDFVYKREYEGEHKCGILYDFKLSSDGLPDITKHHGYDCVFLGWNLTDEQLRVEIQSACFKLLKSLIETVDQQKPNIKQEK